MDEETVYFGFGSVSSLREDDEPEKPSRLEGMKSISAAAKAAFERSPAALPTRRQIGFAIPRRP